MNKYRIWNYQYNIGKVPSICTYLSNSEFSNRLCINIFYCNENLKNDKKLLEEFLFHYLGWIQIKKFQSTLLPLALWYGTLWAFLFVFYNLLTFRFSWRWKLSQSYQTIDESCFNVEPFICKMSVNVFKFSNASIYTLLIHIPIIYHYIPVGFYIRFQNSMKMVIIPGLV